MDPLSVSSSIAGIVTLASQICVIISELRHDCAALPGRIHALSNEVEDLRVVLYEVGNVVKDRAVGGTINNVETEILELLSQGKKHLFQVRSILGRVRLTGQKRREAIFRTLAWRKKQKSIALLQYDINRIKSSLNVLVGASNS